LLRVDGKVALVTGGAKGLGHAQSQLLAAEGATVIVSDVDVDEGEATARSLGDRGTFVEHDVSSPDSWQSLRSQIVQRFGRLDILVNNAAIIIPGSIEDISYEDWRRVQAVNIEGVYLGCQTAIALMKEFGGSIINISSVASHQGEPFNAAYAATKGAVRSLTKSVAVYCKVKGYDIRCNSVHPGAMDTPMVHGLRKNAGLPSSRAGLGDPAQVAYGVVYLASDESSLMTGAELVIDAGRTITPPIERGV
jgi:NAD(P)-dependent dehydrogenase (short-subunit alcohol dehydrogenase family)